MTSGEKQRDVTDTPFHGSGLKLFPQWERRRFKTAAAFAILTTLVSLPLVAVFVVPGPPWLLLC